MSVLKKNQINKILKKFKKRKNLKKEDYFKLKFGNVGFFFNKDCRFEFIYLSLLKKILKNLNFLKFKIRKFNKIWIFVNKNYPISTKSKNSRMGKGKGSFLRWTFRLARFSTFLELASLDFLKIKKFKKK
jgi:ribosomal protein L16/L10AE